MKLPIPADILIQTPGAYLVGGSVRDLICKRRPVDYDIAVANDAKGYAQQLAAKLNGRIVVIGKPDYPLYRIVKARHVIDVTPIKGTSIETDLADRDFTINALACELINGRLIDTCGGLADIRQGVVRMVSAQALQNDPVRMVRAFRLAALLNFTIAAATSQAISTQAKGIDTCAGERIWAEMALILAQPNSFHTLQLMVKSGLLLAILPELVPLQDCRQNKPHRLDVFEHTLEAYASLEMLLGQPDRHFTGRALDWVHTLSAHRLVLLKLALLLHDIGKPAQRTIEASGKIHFYGHPAAGARLAEAILSRLRLSRRQIRWALFLIAHHSRPHDLFLAEQKNELTPKAIGRFLRLGGDATPYLILHAMADNYGKALTDRGQLAARLTFFNSLLDAYYKTARPQETPPLVDGHDLMATFKLKSSPLIGTLINGIEEARLAGTITHRRQALTWAETYLKENGILT